MLSSNIADGRGQRCDGAQPVCGQCTRAGRQADCEYTDAQGRSRTIILEERISELEDRIRQLQDPGASESLVLLHDPLESTPASPSLSTHSRQSYISSSSDVPDASVNIGQQGSELPAEHLPALCV